MIMSKLGEKESPATHFIFQRPQFKHRFFDLLIWKNWNLIIITIISHGISCKKSLKRHGIPFYKICIILIPCSHFFHIPSLLFLYFFLHYETFFHYPPLFPLPPVYLSLPRCLSLSSPLSLSLLPSVRCLFYFGFKIIVLFSTCFYLVLVSLPPLLSISLSLSPFSPSHCFLVFPSCFSFSLALPPHFLFLSLSTPPFSLPLFFFTL